MSEQIDILKDDIAFLRGLAQEGRRTPLLGGVSLLVAGLVYSAATLVCWTMSAGLLAASGYWYLGVWVVAMIVQFAVMTLVINHLRRRTGGPPASTVANRAFRWAWGACGWAILSIFLGSASMAWRQHSALIFATFPTIVLSLYGAAWTISAAMSDRWWLRWVAAGSFLAAVVITMLPDPTATYLAFAAALLLLMAAPGFALMREEPSVVG